MADWVKNLFATIDRKDADGFAAYLTEDARFRFGNAPAAVGRENVRDAVADFFSSIKGLDHDILDVWDTGETVIVELEITYTRLDEQQVVLPCANVFRMRDGKVGDYLIFMDISPVYA